MDATHSSWKKGRLAANLEAPPSADLADAIAKVEELRAQNRARAEKWGVPYVEPNIVASGVIDKTSYLRLTRQTAPGEVTGFDATSPEEDARRATRATRFQAAPFCYEEERLKLAGLTTEEVALRKERRERAARFGVADPIDVSIAKAALEALGDNPAEEGVALRGTVLHMRAFRYLPAANADILAFFNPIKPAFVEWLNGASVNVLFEDEGTARRALELTAEPVVCVPDVARVKECWRVALRPLVKQRRDKYAPEGATMTVYLRVANVDDTREKLGKSSGPRKMGTYSAEGAFSLAKLRMEDAMVEDEGGHRGRDGHRGGGGEDDAMDLTLHLGGASGGEGGAVDRTRLALAVTGTLRDAAAHLATAFVTALPDRRALPAPASAPLMGGGSRPIEVRKRGEGGTTVLRMADTRLSGPLVVTKRAQPAPGADGTEPTVIKPARGRGRDKAAALVGGHPPPPRSGGQKRGREADDDGALAAAEARAADAGVDVDALPQRGRDDEEGGGGGRGEEDDFDGDAGAYLAALDAEEEAALAEVGGGEPSWAQATQPLTQHGGGGGVSHTRVPDEEL